MSQGTRRHTFVNSDDYKLPNGSTNWNAVRSARIRNGEICDQCGDPVIFHKGHQTTCGDCESLSNDPDEVSHSDYVRCPHCGKFWRPSDTEDYKCYGDGEHSLSCGHCGEDFEVTTYVSYSFTSPARTLAGDPEANMNGEDEEDEDE